MPEKTPVQIRIEDKTKTLESLANNLSDANITKANVRAINTAIRKANTKYRRELSEKYNLKYADTKELVVPKNATYGKPEGNISGRIMPLSLSRFAPAFIKSGRVFSIKSVKNKSNGKRMLEQRSKKTKDTGKGVSFEIKKGQRKSLPYAFLIDKNKRPGVGLQIWARGAYEPGGFRLDKKRMPIAPLKTLSAFGGMTKHEISEAVEKGASEDMQKEFKRQLDLLLKQTQNATT